MDSDKQKRKYDVKLNFKKHHKSPDVIEKNIYTRLCKTFF